MPSKLCPHIQILDAATLDAIARVQPPIVKTMDLDRHSLQAIRSAAATDTDCSAQVCGLPGLFGTARSRNGIR